MPGARPEMMNTLIASRISTGERAGTQEIYWDSDGWVIRGKVYLGENTEDQPVLHLNGERFITTYAEAGSDGHNTFVGQNAGNTTLYYDTGANPQGAHNVGFGDSALQSLTTGYANCAFGYTSLQYTTTGYHNAGFGDDTLRENTSGYNNTAVGIISMRSNTSGYLNTSVGWASGDSNTEGFRNTAIGAQALQLNVTGERNTALGEAALYNILGSRNTGIGHNALYTNTGSDNVALGAFAGFYETGNAKLFIDNATRADEADGRTKALVYGVFAAAVANQSLTFNAGSMGFFGHVAAAQPTKAGHNNWAALTDVVAALVEIGIFDAA